MPVVFDAAAALGPIETYLAAGHKLPMVLMTCNRATLLEQTLASLAAVRGFRAADLMVLQDGFDAAVEATVRRHGLELQQNAPEGPVKDPKTGKVAHPDGARRIAQHYRFALTHGFARRPEAPALLVLEDDLLFSPDLIEYFEHNAPVLERDPTAFVLSAWNDNGFRGKALHPGEMRRTEYFPGLGWLLSRRLWEGELATKWPLTHWDHWMREPEQRRERESIHPEVPRVYHNGVKGTFMDERMHNQLFKDIAYNVNASFRWTPDPATGYPAYAAAMHDNYEAQITSWLTVALHTADAAEAAAATEGEIVLWYILRPVNTMPEPKPPLFQPLADRFGLWHECQRTAHNGMLHFHRDGAHVILVNAAASPYVNFKPRHVLPIDLHTAAGKRAARASGPALSSEQAKQLREMVTAMVPVAAVEYGQNCNDICAHSGGGGNNGLRCEAQLLPHINACVEMQRHFGCKVCSDSYGHEQPAFVDPAGPPGNNPGECLLTDRPNESTCAAAHVLTRRLCPCVPK